MNHTTCQRPVDVPVRCHYADNPPLRPHCTLTPVVRYGSVLLCADCQTRRSTLGKGQTPNPVNAPDLDPLDWITAAQQQVITAEHTLTAAITRARQHGHSWTTIGAHLGITRQAAQQRYARTTPPHGAKIPADQWGQIT